MKIIIKTIRGIARDDSGASAIEYGLLAALISTAFIMGAAALGTSINDVNQQSANEIDDVIATIAGHGGVGGGVGGGDGGGRENNRGNGAN